MILLGFEILLVLGFSSFVYELCKTKKDENIIITENPPPYQN